MSEYKDFYDTRRHETYAQDYSHYDPRSHGRYEDLVNFVRSYGLEKKRVLEIGSSGGFFQDIVDDYWGTDIAQSLSKYYHKPYRVTDGTRFPFEDQMFDAVFTIDVFEHVPDLERACLEIKRLLKPTGLLFFAPAWQCRPWAAEGYAVRPYSDFDFKGKFIKFLIPLRNSVPWRLMGIAPKRLFRHCMFVFGFRNKSIRYKKLKPNYKIFWTSDSDACNSIDPHDAILWFESQGFTCLSHPMHFRSLMIRNGPLIFRKN
ncbi:MAG: class I SAM-dependent methyltransferase [Syntrophaceae bacterium]|nr:class I SAM-dependent methyltransferase [Syntrophaceae bacterium]